LIRTRGTHLALVGLVSLVALVALTAVPLTGCGKKVKRRKRRSIRPPTEPTMASNLADVGRPSADLAARKRPKKRKRSKTRRVSGPGVALPKADEFTERDFVENPQESRDPFRNLLIKEPTKAEPRLLDRGDIVYLKDYPLAELRVTGIVGNRRRFAMVRDPRTGRTTILKKRDRLGKERALIFEIKRDHLVLLVPRLRPEKADPYERKTLYVDETRKIVEIGSDPIRPDESGIRIFGHRRRRRGTDRAKER
jgi:hypothetical protein